MTVSIAMLPGRAVLGVEGAGTRDFLHSLLTSDLLPLDTGQAAYGALLTPQGKIMFDVFAVATETGFLLDAAAASADDLARRLTMYRLRRKIDIDLKTDLAIAAMWGGEEQPELEETMLFRDPRAPGMGWRAIGPMARLQAAATADADRYEAHRIALGIADSGRDIGSGQLFPHEANLDQLNGVSFTKGCYVGQEVVSRMEHRGTARNRIVPFRFEGRQIAPETAVSAGGRSLGRILSTADGRGLALMRLDRAEAARAAGQALLAGDTPIAVERPEWARYRVTGDA